MTESAVVAEGERVDFYNAAAAGGSPRLGSFICSRVVGSVGGPGECTQYEVDGVLKQRKRSSRLPYGLAMVTAS